MLPDPRPDRLDALQRIFGDAVKPTDGGFYISVPKPERSLDYDDVPDDGGGTATLERPRRTEERADELDAPHQIILRMLRFAGATELNVNETEEEHRIQITNQSVDLAMGKLRGIQVGHYLEFTHGELPDKFIPAFILVKLTALTNTEKAGQEPVKWKIAEKAGVPVFMTEEDVANPRAAVHQICERLDVSYDFIGTLSRADGVVAIPCDRITRDHIKILDNLAGNSTLMTNMKPTSREAVRQ